MHANVMARKMEEKDQVILMRRSSLEEMRAGKRRFSTIPVPDSGWYEVCWVNMTLCTEQEKLWGEVIAHFLPKEEADFICVLLNVHEMSQIKPAIHAIIAYAVKREGVLQKVW